MYYYEVGLSAERHWENAVFTYAYEEDIELNRIVRVPFGKTKKLGLVLRKVKKPSFSLKSIERVLPHAEMPRLREFLNWYSGYYADSSGALYGQFLPNYLTVTPKITDLKTPEQKKIILGDQQKAAVEKITNHQKATVLHGVTGSGKTRVYIDLILSTIRKGQSALLLYPEISLTPQFVEELSLYVPLLVFHSQLSDSERSRLWHTVASTDQPYVVIGPRSAMFLPHRNLGCIIIDEAHESTYKQDSDIHYNALHVAGGLAKIHSAKLVLGSATPPVTETEQILSRGGQLVCMHDKAIEHNYKRSVQIVDLRKPDNFKKHPLLSDALLEKIQVALSNKKQTLLFINRRGTAKLVLCSGPDCDWQANCSSCELPMTFHHDSHVLICHTCGSRQKMPHTCPNCGSEISQKSFGSKAYVDDIQKLFPQANISRFDSDNLAEESFANNYNDVLSGNN
jgi:primosomal protein N' (replication factor Y) (superfamily II helicase)